MPSAPATAIKFEGRDVPLLGEQSVLDALLAAGIRVPAGCRSGICQSCLLQCVDGNMPAFAQAGLSAELRETGHFLACQARGVDGWVLRRAGWQGLRWRSRVAGISKLCDGVFRLRLERPAGFAYRAGQYVTLWRDAQTCRAYSLASLPDDDHLEFHVRHLPDGAVSHWLAERKIGDAIDLQGPAGSCHYRLADQSAAYPLLLVGTGTGLAPLWGVLRTALAARHDGPIHLVHVVRTLSQAYLNHELLDLAERHENLTYDIHLDGLKTLDFRVLQLSRSFSGWQIHLCGQPETVHRLRKQLFLAGASSRDIHADAFVPQAPVESLAASGS